MSASRCAYCGTTDGDFHLDHVVPRSRGGPDSPRNLVKACAKCNGAKTDKLPSEWLDIVPANIAAIEAAVSETVEVAIRSRRGRQARSPLHREAKCDICEDAIRPEERRHWGWVRWWFSPHDHDEREVVRCALLCSSRRCAMAAGNINTCGDLPVEWVSEERAVSQLWRLMRDYRWSESAAERLCDAMHALQFLPTWERDTPDVFALNG